MGRIKGHYEWDDDDLSPGQKKEGGLHQNLFDSDGNLKGNARFIPDDNSDPDEPFVVTETVYIPAEQRRLTREQEELAELIADLLAIMVERGIAKAKPFAKELWRGKARPFIDAQRDKIHERRTLRKTAKTSPIVEGATLEPSREVAETSEDSRPNMSRAEAQARCLAALAATAYSEEQRRLVTNARIVDSDGPVELKHSLSELPTDQVKGLIEAMVTNPSLLGEDTLAELASVLGRRAL